MKIQLVIAPDDTLTESDLAEMHRRAADDGKETGEWAAAVILRELNKPTQGPEIKKDAALAA